MEYRARRKSQQRKKSRSKAQEKFAKKFPYRFSWLTDPRCESPRAWEGRRSSQRDLLPLQKQLVPRRSIPVPGLGAPGYSSPSSVYPAPPPCSLWELQLLSLRFPRQAERQLFPVYSNDPWSSEATGPSRGLS
uniref:Chromosome 3 open reading frame 22 n=1 Tax=Sciurus vulgaris TaxID=55149 RepID=A0A8D2JP69_SCIVU